MSSQHQPAINLKPKTSSRRQKRNQRDRLLMSLTVILVLAAWFYGYVANGTDIAPLVTEVLPGIAHVENRGDLFVGLDANGNVIGYAAAGTAPGYGGPIETLVGVDPAGQILGVKIITRHESPGFFRLLEKHDLLGQFARHHVSDPLRLGQDLDAVTGATFSAEGVVNSVKVAARQIATDGLKAPLPPEHRSLKFGIPEVVLLLLFVAGYFGHKLHRPALKRRIRWGTLLTGMLVLGFIYTSPFTIAMVISLFSGYWPDWHNNLYWYLLIGGILFVTTVDAKNPYCGWFCPFGAFQECLAAASGAKSYRPRDLAVPLKWLQRGLALTAIIIGLATRQPGAAGYEPFATLFDVRGTLFQWIFLTIIILASLAMYRPFCAYLCPIDPVVDFIATARRWLKEVWSTWQSRPAKP